MVAPSLVLLRQWRTGVVVLKFSVGKAEKFAGWFGIVFCSHRFVLTNHYIDAIESTLPFQVQHVQNVYIQKYATKSIATGRASYLFVPLLKSESEAALGRSEAIGDWCPASAITAGSGGEGGRLL